MSRDDVRRAWGTARHRNQDPEATSPGAWLIRTERVVYSSRPVPPDRGTGHSVNLVPFELLTSCLAAICTLVRTTVTIGLVFSLSPCHCWLTSPQLKEPLSVHPKLSGQSRDPTGATKKAQSCVNLHKKVNVNCAFDLQVLFLSDKASTHKLWTVLIHLSA